MPELPPLLLFDVSFLDVCSGWNNLTPLAIATEEWNGINHCLRCRYNTVSALDEAGQSGLIQWIEHGPLRLRRHRVESNNETCIVAQPGIEEFNYWKRRMDVNNIGLLDLTCIGSRKRWCDGCTEDCPHRRNVATRGGDVHDQLGHRFEIGEATFEGTRPRPPCAHVERVADEEGVMEALAEGRGGICADVIDGGELRVGDEFGATEPANPDPASIARAMRERAAENTERRVE